MTRRIMLTLFFLLLELAGSPAAFAQAELSESFQCTGGRAQGSLFVKQPCPVDENTILSGTVCTFEQTLSDIFSDIYCGTKQAIMTPLLLAMALAVMIFAIMFLTGMVRLSTGEAAKVLFKILLVFVFATQAEYAIGLAYRFLMSVSREGIAIVLEPIRPSSSLGQAWDARNAMRFLDQLVVEAATPLTFDTARVSQAVNSGNGCQNALIALLVLTAIFLPPLFIMVVYVIIQTLTVFVRAVFGYLLAITGITFLMTMSPIFFTFALFTPTYRFFEKWLQYMISFTLQMIIVFSFLSLMQLMDIGKFLGRVLELVQPWSPTGADLAKFGPKIGMPESFAMLFKNVTINLPWCSICEYHMETPAYYNMEVPVCNSGSAFKVIPPTDLSYMVGFGSMLAEKLVALGILAYILEAFLRYAPEMAKVIAGTPYSARIGGNVEDYAGRFIGTQGGAPKLFGTETLGKAADNFLGGFSKTPGYAPSKAIGAMTSTARGMRGNFQRELFGKDGGSGGGISDFLTTKAYIHHNT